MCAEGLKPVPQQITPAIEQAVRHNGEPHVTHALRHIAMSNTVLQVQPLGSTPWPTLDPFLFCVHHNDAYPQGNAHLGPNADLTGRSQGQDFAAKGGWSMYHGHTVPGFPAHPHRGFETITIARSGLVDHSDSLGATARFSAGDVQWLTAGKGIVHCEMFPLLQTDASNPLELFQIWLNLPAKSKMADPHFTMLWNETVPSVRMADASGLQTDIRCIAGTWGTTASLAPPPASWASEPDSELGICTVTMESHALWDIPTAASPNTHRQIYFFKGQHLTIDGQSVTAPCAVEVRADSVCTLVNGAQDAELLILQGRPIGEPVAQYGPFVMNTQAEVQQAFSDYRRTQFGGWPWGAPDPTHPRSAQRFAKRADGSLHLPGVSKTQS